MTLEKLIRVTLRHFENRLFELATSAMMTGLAAWIIIWPQAIGASLFRLALDFVSQSAIVMILGAGGPLRLAALVANGSWPQYGPKLRACGAFVGSLVWSQMATSLALYHANTGKPPSPGIWIYLVLTLVELIAMCRALVDHGRTD